MDDSGLARMVTKGTGGDQKTKLEFISGPFEILGRVRDPRGEGWARLLRWSDDDKRVHTFSVSDADLHGDMSSLCANLASRGLKIATGRRNREALIRYLNGAVVENRVTLVERTGWHDVGSIKQGLCAPKCDGWACC
jgi:putative DNA primase/helicase